MTYRQQQQAASSSSPSLEELKSHVLRNCHRRVPQRDEAASLCDSVSTGTERLVSLAESAHPTAGVAHKSSNSTQAIRKATLGRQLAESLYNVLKVAVAANVVLHESDATGVPTVPLRLFEEKRRQLAAEQQQHQQEIPETSGRPRAFSTSSTVVSATAFTGPSILSEIGRRPVPAPPQPKSKTSKGTLTRHTSDDASSTTAAFGYGSMRQQQDVFPSSDLEDDDEEEIDSPLLNVEQYGSFMADVNVNHVNSIPASTAASPLDVGLPPQHQHQHHHLVGAQGVGSFSMGSAVVPVKGHNRSKSDAERAQLFEQLWFQNPVEASSAVIGDRLIALIDAGDADEDMLEGINAEVHFIHSLASGACELVGQNMMSALHVQFDAARDSYERADKALVRAERRHSRKLKRKNQ